MIKASAIRFLSVLFSIFIVLPVLLISSGCGKDGEEVSTPLTEPIVPGYSLAGLLIGESFAAVEEKLGAADSREAMPGYIVLLYSIGQEPHEENGNMQAPNLRVTFYDHNHDQTIADNELVGKIEVTMPYTGITYEGNGIGSTPEQIQEEFGEIEDPLASDPEGIFKFYSYTEQGIEFALDKENERAFSVSVFERGGLKPVPIPEYADGNGAEGDGIFRGFESEPVLAGTSVAGIAIDSSYSEVIQVLGEADEIRTSPGFIELAYTGGYGNWKCMVTLLDNDNDRQPGEFDTVVSIAVKFPYQGTTPGGVGIGSNASLVSSEFGDPSAKRQEVIEGKKGEVWEYPNRGIVFAVESSSNTVVEINVNKN